jgi:hypothetical protein
MYSFKQYLNESAIHDLQGMAESDVPGVPKTLHDFLFHLSSPSDPYGKSSHINESSEVTEEVKRIEIHHGRNTPKADAMIEKGNSLIPHDANIHKRIHEGFRKAFQEMGKENEKESKNKLKESHKVLHDFVKSYGMKTRPELLGENGKTKKSSGEGVHTKGLALAPHTTNGLKNFDVCPRASSECRKNCLGTEAGGNKQYPDTALSSKVWKTHFLAMHPEHAARILDHEVGNHAKKAEKKGYKPGVRLNVTSDIAWEHHAPELFHRHPNVQFYDYTKMHNRVGHKNLPKNYHLTLSHTGANHAESNDKHVADTLAKGHVAAMVYHRGKGTPTPTHAEDVKTGKRYPIVNGDHDDNTFDRHVVAGKTEGHPGHGVVSGLKLKGVSNEAAGHFANKVDKDGIIRFNH